MKAALHFPMGLIPSGWPPIFVPQELHAGQDSAPHIPQASSTITGVKASLRECASEPGLAFTLESMDSRYWFDSRRRRLLYSLLTFLARRWPSLSPWKPAFPSPFLMPAGSLYTTFPLPEPVQFVQGFTHRTRIIQVGRHQPGTGLQITFITEY